MSSHTYAELYVGQIPKNGSKGICIYHFDRFCQITSSEIGEIDTPPRIIKGPIASNSYHPVCYQASRTLSM